MNGKAVKILEHAGMTGRCSASDRWRPNRDRFIAGSFDVRLAEQYLLISLSDELLWKLILWVKNNLARFLFLNTLQLHQLFCGFVFLHHAHPEIRWGSLSALSVALHFSLLNNNRHYKPVRQLWRHQSALSHAESETRIMRSTACKHA